MQSWPSSDDIAAADVVAGTNPAGDAAPVVDHTRTEKGTDGKQCVLVLFDGDLLGESLHNPGIRKPPFNEGSYYNTMMHGVLQRHDHETSFR